MNENFLHIKFLIIKHLDFLWKEGASYVCHFRLSTLPALRIFNAQFIIQLL